MPTIAAMDLMNRIEQAFIDYEGTRDRTAFLGMLAWCKEQASKIDSPRPVEVPASAGPFSTRTNQLSPAVQPMQGVDLDDDPEGDVDS